jgi:parvulin-like peptidyl-prolyl isomerase
MEALKVEVADRLIDRTLALAEAKRRGIQADRETIKRAIAGYEERYKQSDQWKKKRKQMIAAVTKQLEEQSQLERLEASVRAVPEPTEAQAQAFYESHPDLFTEPEKIRLSVILLRVDPSSPKVAWEKAAEEAASIVDRLRNGAQFEELAKVHSGDASAERGGDLGYLHRGVLPEGTQALIDSLEPGAISEPVRLLEGMAVIRVVDRKPAHRHDFAQVRERAGDLWQREQGEAQWKRLMAQLRSGSVIRINTSRYPALEQVAAHDKRPDTR